MLLKLSWRNLWRNKKRSVITISSITIALFLAVFMRSFQLGMYSNMINNVVGSYTGYVQIHSKGFWKEQSLDNSFEVSKILINDINSIDGVDNVLQRIETFSLASVDDKTKAVLIQGLNIEQEQKMLDWKKRLIDGSLFNGAKNEVLLAKGVARFFKINVNDTIVFIGQGYHGVSAAGKFLVAGIVDMKNPKLNNFSVFMTLETSQIYLAAENVITHLIIDKKDDFKEKELLKNIKSKITDNSLEIMDWREMLPELEQTIIADSVGGLLMVFILYMIITFGIFGTVLMMTQERIFELGVLLSIGMKRIKLIAILVFESVILTLIGIGLGTILVLPFMYYFKANPIHLAGNQAAAIEKFGFEATIPMLTDYDIPLSHGTIIFVISLIISLYPIVVVLRLNPLKAMKK